MISIIIPCHNLHQRGFDRLIYSVYSLTKQTAIPEIIVVDSSLREAYDVVHSKLEALGAKHLPFAATEWNMPKLFNYGMREAENGWLLATGVDFLYSKDMMERFMESAKKDRFCWKPNLKLPKTDISFEMINEWNFPEGKPSPHGKWANGIQFFHRDWFDYSGGYDERMKGWCGMDNDFYMRAEKYGMEMIQVNSGEVFHQWHLNEKHKTLRSEKQSQENWKLRDAPNATIIRNKK